MTSTALLPPAPTASPERPPADRDHLLTTVLGKAHLITPPAVAMKVVNLASDPECKLAELVALVGQDPALAAKLLRTVNSSLYALPTPVASLERAVVVIGLSSLRSLVLGYSLPVMQAARTVTNSLRRYWVTSVTGSILAREFAILLRRPAPDFDMTAGLLRNLGQMLIERTWPDLWAQVQDAPPERRLREPCAVEREILGVDHAEVTAELLARWNLPPEVAEPIRHHHAPERLAAQPPSIRERAELLAFVELLSQMDEVGRHPALLVEVLRTAETKYGLTAPVLTQFLGSVMPKVDEFARLLDLNIGERPDFEAILAAGCDEMVRLAVQPSALPANGASQVAAAVARPWPAPDVSVATPPPVAAVADPAPAASEAARPQPWFQSAVLPVVIAAIGLASFAVALWYFRGR